MTNQDKREVLEMLVGIYQRNGADVLANMFRREVSKLPKNKPEREMPLDGGTYLFIVNNDKFGFTVIEDIWNKHYSYNKDLWNSGRVFLLSERALAEKKCAELNEILRR